MRAAAIFLRISGKSLRCYYSKSEARKPAPQKKAQMRAIQTHRAPFC